MTQFINIDERYGGAEKTTLADYQELKPLGVFEQSETGVFELLNYWQDPETGEQFFDWKRVAMTWAEWEGTE